MSSRFRDMLLLMISYPRPTPESAIDAAFGAAELFEARLSAVLCQIHLPRVSNWLAEKLVRANELIDAENRKSRDTARHLLEAFASRVPEDRRGDELLVDSLSLLDWNALARRARSHDLTIVPVDPAVDHRAAAEALIFDSGRPVLLLPARRGSGHRIQHVLVGWDGSRSAARALADALPFCHAAQSVRVVAVTGDKAFKPDETLSGVERHLRLHGISPLLEQVSSDGSDAGARLLDHAAGVGADLLVMGGYGHSRAREFVLGGATHSVLQDPRLPVLLSH